MSAAEVRSFLGRFGNGLPKIDIDFSAVVSELSGCETRLAERDHGCSSAPYWRQEILYDGEWWVVGQTSLCDDVATGLCANSEEEAQTLAKFLERTQYGVRLHRYSQTTGFVVGALSVITHMTDG